MNLRKNHGSENAGHSLTTEKILEDLQEILNANVPPAGLSAAITTSGSTPILLQAGQADILENKPILDSHIFGIGSITKVFVAVVTLQLIEEHKLKLTDTVSQYLDDEITHKIEHASTATIDELLSHRSRIDSWEDDPDWLRHGRGDLVRPEHIWSKTEPLEFIRRPSRTSKPGYSYSNTNYTLIGLIIEKITGSTAESEIRRRILTPLDMNLTFVEGFEPPRQVIPCRYHVATAEFRKNVGICPSFPEVGNDIIEARGYNLSTSWMAGGMISHPSDLLKFAVALRDGKLLLPESAAIMQQWKDAGTDHEMGHGLFRMTRPSGQWLGHSGGVLGFSAGLWWHQDVDCVVCVLGNLGIVNTGGASTGMHNVIMNSEFLAKAKELV